MPYNNKTQSLALQYEGALKILLHSNKGSDHNMVYNFQKMLLEKQKKNYRLCNYKQNVDKFINLKYIKNSTNETNKFQNLFDKQIDRRRSHKQEFKYDHKYQKRRNNQKKIRGFEVNFQSPKVQLLEAMKKLDDQQFQSMVANKKYLSMCKDYNNGNNSIQNPEQNRQFGQFMTKYDLNKIVSQNGYKSIKKQNKNNDYPILNRYRSHNNFLRPKMRLLNPKLQSTMKIKQLEQNQPTLEQLKNSIETEKAKIVPIPKINIYSVMKKIKSVNQFVRKI